MKALGVIAAATVVAAVLGGTDLSHCQSTGRGRELIETLEKKYPRARPTATGLATKRPAVAVVLPDAEWNLLSADDRRSLRLYAESLIPDVRAHPDKYVDAALQAQPDYDAWRAKLIRLCDGCWVVGVGRLTLDRRGVLFERIVMQGIPSAKDGASVVAMQTSEAFSVRAVSPPANDGGGQAPAHGWHGTVSVRIRAANIRSGPGKRYSVIGWGAWGQTFRVKGSYAGWFKVDYYGRDGWVAGDLVMTRSSGDGGGQGNRALERERSSPASGTPRRSPPW